MVKHALVETRYNVIVVRNLKTGGRFISVRKSTETDLRNRVNAALDNPDYTMPIVLSVREYGDENHVYNMVATYKTKLEAQEHKASLIMSAGNRAVSLNAAMPRVGLEASDSADWRFYSVEATAEMIKAKKAKARKAKAAAKAEPTISA